MSETGGVSRLCSVIHHSLRQFTESDLVALTPDKERDLLISLSEVLNEIRRWTKELEGEQQGSGCCTGNCDSHSGNHECLTLIVANLISLLNVKSKYARHLVTNTCLVISEFLANIGSNWDSFIQLLCICFEFTLCNMGVQSLKSSISGAENSKSILLNLSLLRLKLNCSSWNTTAGIIGILRGMIKRLKGGDDELVRVLLNSLSISLMKIPWDMLNVVHNNSCVKDGTSLTNDASLLMNAGEIEVKILFFGNLVQLLCSLVGLTGSEEARTGPHDKLFILHETCELVPKLLYWCLAEEWSGKFWHILPYFQHKILMLMIRLSFLVQLDCSILVQWLELIHKYYQDLLKRPISQFEYGEDDVLEGSPFLLSLYDQEAHPLSSRHFQSLAVFLFLRCSLRLIGLRKSTDDLKCSCMSPNSYCVPELNAIRDCCAAKKGLLDFFGWLQSHVPSIMFSDDDMYLERCIKFASSFIKLYIHEDDMLFEVLLQIFLVPSSVERRFFKEERTCQSVEEVFLFHISNFFNPVLLFHVFLAQLQYDHQLLLDYLISKDTGSKCAEYLLRCLRTVCDSWTLFVEFSVNKHAVCQKNCKRRRSFCEDSYKEQSAAQSQSGLALSSEQHPEEQELVNKFCENTRIRLEDAKACLLSLKSSLKKLHQRKLFPYNPEVLIRRLTMFEELCNRHD